MSLYSFNSKYRSRNNRLRTNKKSILSGGYSNYRRSIKTRGLVNSGNAKVIRLPLGNIVLSKAVVKNVLTTIVAVCGFVFVVMAFVLMIFLQKVSAQMPDASSITSMEFAETTKVYDRNGVLLFETFGNENREYVTIDKIPNQVKWSLLAAEDIDFYNHKGLDFPGIAKAVYVRIKNGEWGRGSSTITQQLVRNTALRQFLGEGAYKKTVSRKLQEMLVSMKVEQELTKDQILEYYMNIVPLGGTIYGYQAAAKMYFSKDVSELTLAESAILAGIIQAPGYYSPLYGIEPSMAKERQEYVFQQLEKHIDQTGITQEQIDAARQEEIVYRPGTLDMKAPHFSIWVRQLLVDMFGEEIVNSGGLQVTTTLDYDMQMVAEEEVKKSIDGKDGQKGAREKYNVNNEGLVAIDPQTGQVLVMVGSYDYYKIDDPRIDGQVNVVLSPRQMGSAAKPIAYLTSFTQGYYPSLITPDIRMTFGGNYTPDNWNRKFNGHMLMRDALLMSRNLPAVYATELVGVDSFLQSAQRLGINMGDKSSYGLSLGLGAGEMKLLELTEAYTVFATGGIRHNPTPLLEVKDKNGNVLYKFDNGSGDRVFTERETYLINWILCNESNVERLGKPYFTIGGQKMCGKTGTTDGPKDLTTFMYYPNLAVGVWAGNNNNEVVCGVRNSKGECAGSQGWSENVPLPLANAFMLRVLGKFDKATIHRPGGIISTKVCKDSGLPADDSNPCQKIESVFIADNVPEKDKSHNQVAICKLNGMVATNADEAKQMGLVDYVFVIDIPLANKSHQEEWNNWLRENKHVIAEMNGISTEQFVFKFELPGEAECPLGLGVDNTPVIGIQSPVENQEIVKGNSFDIKYTVLSMDPIIGVDVFVDNSTSAIFHVDGNPGKITLSIPSTSQAGTKTLTVKVTDNAGRVGFGSVIVKVLDVYDISVVASVSGDDTIMAKLSGKDISKVTNVVIKFYKDGAEFTSLNASSINLQEWSGIIDHTLIPNGKYTVVISAYAGQQVFVSNTVNLTVG